MNSRKPVDIGYLVVGLVFIGLAGAWLLDETGVIARDGLQWLVPAVLLGAGLAGLFTSLGKGFVGRQEPGADGRLDDTLPVHDLTSDLDRKLSEEAAGAARAQVSPDTSPDTSADTGTDTSPDPRESPS